MISILTVNHNSADDLAALVDSLLTHAPHQEMELIITNNSREEQLDFDFDPVLPVTIIPSPNVGFARGINLALREAHGDILFIANPDVRITAGTFDRVDVFLQDHPDVGLVLPMLRDPDGGLQRSVRRFYTWPVILYARSPLRLIGPPPAFFRRYLYEDLDRSAPADVDWGLGGAMFLRKSDVDTGGVFDERFFLYFEDVDLCYRMWQRNRRVTYCPHIECIHAHRRLSRMPLSQSGWHHFQSMLRFIAKHRGLPGRPKWGGGVHPLFSRVDNLS